MERDTLLVKFGLAYVDNGTVKIYDKPAKIHEVNQLASDQMSHLSLETLEEYTFVFTAYLGYIITEQNKRKYDFILLKDEYEERLTRESYKLQGATKKEREAKALDTSPALKELKDKYLRAQAELALIEKIPEATIERLNYFKKVYDRRTNEKQFGRSAH